MSDFLDELTMEDVSVEKQSEVLVSKEDTSTKTPDEWWQEKYDEGYDYVFVLMKSFKFTGSAKETIPILIAQIEEVRTFYEQIVSQCYDECSDVQIVHTMTDFAIGDNIPISLYETPTNAANELDGHFLQKTNYWECVHFFKIAVKTPARRPLKTFMNLSAAVYGLMHRSVGIDIDLSHGFFIYPRSEEYGHFVKCLVAEDKLTFDNSVSADAYFYKEKLHRALNPQTYLFETFDTKEDRLNETIKETYAELRRLCIINNDDSAALDTLNSWVKKRL